MASFPERVKSAWNAFVDIKTDSFQPEPMSSTSFGGFYGISPGRTRLRIANERSIISSIYTRMSMDLSSIDIRHTRHDADDRYAEDVPSGLNDCLTVEANIDQGARAFRQDIVLTLFDKGVAAIVPVDTTIDPKVSGSFDIKTLRVGEITQWYPNHVRVNLYNERIGARREIILEKRTVAIVENPLYSVMNEPNSTLQRLMRKLAMLDSVDEASSSGKLDLIIQLPYVIKSEARKQQAEQRRQDIEFQLKGSQYGIAYTDGTEKITQLNRPTENNLLTQIEYLTNHLYGQLGITPEVMNGTATEETMLNYNNRTIEPILMAIIESMRRTFLTKTARTQGQSIDYFRDPFKFVPMANMAMMADKFTRNEIFSSNEIRGFLGAKPSKDPKADLLVNANMPVQKSGVGVPGVTPVPGDPNAGGTSGVPQNPITAPPPPVPPAVEAPYVGTSPLDSVDSSINAAFSAFGEPPPPAMTKLPAPPGDLDPDVVLSSLDDVDKAIDDAFSGLGLDDATS